MATLLKYLTVYALSAFKIILGPTLGATYGFEIWETAGLSLLGMMTTVYLFSFFGPQIRVLSARLVRRKRNKPSRIFTPGKRRYVKVWRRYGVPGIAFLTPILLSPVGGAILANAFGGRRREIIKWMWIFGSLWSLLLTLLVKYAAWLLEDFGLI